jgi:uncharacterized protein YndB with AHSA1/START domain
MAAPYPAKRGMKSCRGGHCLGVAHNETLIKAPPEVVFAVLADPHAYSDWVVGARRIRRYDPTWPEPGSEFHHTVGLGPLTVRDKTTSVELDAPRRIVLEARAMPAGVARVAVDIRPEAGGSRVLMEEHPVRGPGAVLYNPVADMIVRLRNAESLRRLKVIAEGRAETAATPGRPGPAADSA